MTTITQGPDGRPLTAADVREGDTVILAPNPDDGITHLRHLMGPGDVIGSFWRIVSIERPAEPELPTEPGAYMGNDQRPWWLSGDGYWNRLSGIRYRADVAAAFAPFTRLVPAGSEREAAQNAVIDWMYDAGLITLVTHRHVRKHFALGTGDGQ